MMKTSERRSVLKVGLHGLAGLMAMPLLGGLAGCSRPAAKLPVVALGDRMALIDGAPGNVILLQTNEGVLLVDSGSAELARSVQASLDGGRVHTLFNTHYHADQTGGNVLFGEEGATIHAHEITRQWLATDFYVPAEDRWVPALAEAGRPTAVFRKTGDMTAGSESIEYGYLLEAHTRGDIYVFFRDSNVLAVGDVASPLRDPALDWFAGGWLGGRVDAMDDLLALADDATKIVPAYGPVLTRAQLQAERDMMLHLYERTTELTDKGRSAQDMLDAGLMGEVDRRFEDPYRFLYDVSKGLWAHYTNFGGNIV
ncbi:MAG: MBL fold metallo-hydrolase [Pseudomonadales bacterium]|nr:MBL fold metallo-hydrolase [Pseudomonadales bacterium]